MGIARPSWICRGDGKRKASRDEGGTSDESVTRVNCVASHPALRPSVVPRVLRPTRVSPKLLAARPRTEE